MSYRVIFCGARNWAWRRPIAEAISDLHDEHPDLVVVHGGAAGADSAADAIARTWGIPVETFPADWKGKGRAAGPIRNRQMLESGVQQVVAFKRGFDQTLRTGGTENMVRIARAAGVPTRVIGS